MKPALETEWKASALLDDAEKETLEIPGFSLSSFFQNIVNALCT